MRGRAERARIAVAILLLWAVVLPGVLGLSALWNLASPPSALANAVAAVLTTFPLQLACFGSLWALRVPHVPPAAEDRPPRRVWVTAWAVRAIGWLYALRAIDVLFIVLFYPLLSNGSALATGDLEVVDAYLTLGPGVWVGRGLALIVAALTIGAGAFAKAILHGRPKPFARTVFGLTAVVHAIVITSLVVFPTTHSWPMRTNRLVAWYLCREVAYFGDEFVLGAIVQSAAALLTAGAAYVALGEPSGSGSAPDPEVSTSNVD